MSFRDHKLPTFKPGTFFKKTTTLRADEPLSKRPSVVRHGKFRFLDREAAEELLKNSKIGDFIVRPSTRGENTIAVTIVIKEKPKSVKYVLTKDNNYIVHNLISSENPADHFITQSKDPIDEIEKYIKKMGGKFNQKNKSEYLLITVLEEFEELKKQRPMINRC